jgi:hypothetical protein
MKKELKKLWQLLEENTDEYVLLLEIDEALDNAAIALAKKYNYILPSVRKDVPLDVGIICQYIKDAGLEDVEKALDNACIASAKKRDQIRQAIKDAGGKVPEEWKMG